MRKTRLFVILACMVTTALAAAPVLGGVNLDADTVPVAEFADTAYAFAPLLEGVEVVHGFVIRNTGNAVLKIHKIKTG